MNFPRSTYNKKIITESVRSVDTKSRSRRRLLDLESMKFHPDIIIDTNYICPLCTNRNTSAGYIYQEPTDDKGAIKCTPEAKNVSDKAVTEGEKKVDISEKNQCKPQQELFELGVLEEKKNEDATNYQDQQLLCGFTAVEDTFSCLTLQPQVASYLGAKEGVA